MSRSYIGAEVRLTNATVVVSFPGLWTVKWPDIWL